MGNYPYMDAFVMGKWKRMRIFLKYQHVNKGLFGNGEYFSAANYPLNPGMFKIGISWGFYDYRIVLRGVNCPQNNLLC